MGNLIITHYWVTGFGWENTIYLPEDFDRFEQLGENETDGEIWIGYSKDGGKHILKAHH